MMGITIRLLGTPLVSREALAALSRECGAALIYGRDGEACDAVFVFSGRAFDVDAETVAGFIGHPHLRVIGGDTAEKQLRGLRRELEAVLGTDECERKFLVGYPDLAAMERSPFCAAAHIVQTYLVSEEGVTERVRAREIDGRTTYTHTLKRRIDRRTSEEREREVDRAEYEALLRRADGARRPIEKTRWCILYKGSYFELDLYPFWSDRAVVELEIAERGGEAHSEAFPEFPPYFRVIREVTDDVRYKNARLAAEIPLDPLD